MEYIVSCEICSLEYSATETVPRVLDCGHSFCTSCITQLENTLCPKCRANIPCGKEFPINYSLLYLVDECKLEKTLSADIVSSIENLKEKLNSKLFVINKMSEICSKKESIESDLTLLTSMAAQNLNEEYGSKNEMVMRKNLRKLEEKYKECSLVNYLYFDDLDKFSNFTLQDGQTSDSFFQEIYKALRNLERVFAYKCINKKLKFGELTVRDNRIMIHSLSVDEIPRDAKIVQFENLRSNLREKPLHTFFEITTKNSTSHTIIIQLHDTNLVPHFMKLCTAENSSTYRNLTFSKGKNCVLSENVTTKDRHGRQIQNTYEETSLESILEVKITEGLPLDYYKNNSNTVDCEKDEVIVTELANDGFQLFRVKKPNEYSILGKVLYPSDLWSYMTYENDGNILDCGLAIDL